ncbi:Tetraspanin-13 [Cricetulus griseus]|uniref:Tetraspanin-13 n=1 Tax=Cricetulus griseus TaxID=10029 RepID=G3HTR1_CRIGR|nr:Tetraspanin-13 [Cricetulus griseus]
MCWSCASLHLLECKPYNPDDLRDSVVAFWIILVSLLLIGIAAWGIGFGLISSLRVVGVVIAVGIFLFLIALVGLIGAVKHHQVLLFFGQLLEVGWNNTASARNDLQRNLNCCGFRSYNPNDTCLAILGVWLTYRYRNQKDPRANPSAFL